MKIKKNLLLKFHYINNIRLPEIDIKLTHTFSKCLVLIVRCVSAKAEEEK